MSNQSTKVMSTVEHAEECEILSSIYPELCIEYDRPKEGECTISVVLYPRTRDGGSSCHVKVELKIILPVDYPRALPLIKFQSYRGISNAKLKELELCLFQKSKCMLGDSMLFQLLDLVRDFLSSNNRPSSDLDCSICLQSFHETDQFYRSVCFHYFHSKCIGDYLQNISRSVQMKRFIRNGIKPIINCPDCRNDLNTDLTRFGIEGIEKLISAPPPVNGQCIESLEMRVPVTDSVCIPKEWVEKREFNKMLLGKQRKQGGIIESTLKVHEHIVQESWSSASNTPQSYSSSQLLEIMNGVTDIRQVEKPQTIRRSTRRWQTRWTYIPGGTPGQSYYTSITNGNSNLRPLISNFNNNLDFNDYYSSLENIPQVIDLTSEPDENHSTVREPSEIGRQTRTKPHIQNINSQEQRGIHDSRNPFGPRQN